MINNKVISLVEHEEIPIAEFEEQIGKPCVSLLKKVNRRSKCEIFKLMHAKIKATQFVGFVHILGHTIQVVPKIFSNDKPKNLQFLLSLLHHTKKIKIKEQDLGALGSVKDDFFEFLIYLFANSLRDLLRRDFKKKYVVHKENSTFLKGKLLIHQNVRENIFNTSKYYCRFDEFTENNLMNQIFKYVTSILIRESKSTANKRLLDDILIHLCDVDLVNITCTDINKIHFTRLNRQYKPIIEMCRLFLFNLSTEFAVSNMETFVFMFDMNRLFEEFVFEFIKRNRSRMYINNEDLISAVRYQPYLGKLFGEFILKGDILIECFSGRQILIDTKYKLLDNESLHGGLSQSDFYQMFTYATSQAHKYKDIILLYPCVESIDTSYFNNCLEHILNKDESIQIHIRSISLPKIYDSVNSKINTRAMIEEINNTFNINFNLTNAT